MYHKATIALCFLICSFVLCSDSDSHTDTAVIDIVSEYSNSFEETATLCEDVHASESLLLSLPTEIIIEIARYLSLKDTLVLRKASRHFCDELYTAIVVGKYSMDLNTSGTRWFPYFRIKLKGFHEFIRLNNTIGSRTVSSIALERGLVECFHFKILEAFIYFSENSLLESVFVQLENYCPTRNYSNINCQLVDKIIISFIDDDVRKWLKNESFLKSKWKKVHFLVESQPLSFEGFYSLISKMSFEELRFRVPRYRNNLAWSELFASLGEETRKKMHIEGCHFAMDLPDFASIRSHATLLGKTALIQTMESNGLLQFMRKRPLLMELEVKLLYLEDFEKFQDFIQCDDLKKLDRELKITLCYEDLRSGEYFEYSFPSQ